MGFADTNSTCTRLPLPSLVRPKLAPASRMLLTTSRLLACDMWKLINPGPALSTGGFSTKNDSLAHWNDSPMIQYIVVFFMFLAGTNFVLSYFGFKGNFSKIFKDEYKCRYHHISTSHPAKL